MLFPIVKAVRLLLLTRCQGFYSSKRALKAMKNEWIDTFLCLENVPYFEIRIAVTEMDVIET